MPQWALQLPWLLPRDDPLDLFFFRRLFRAGLTRLSLQDRVAHEAGGALDKNAHTKPHVLKRKSNAKAART